MSAAEWMDWEGVARDFQDSTGVDDPPVDANVVAYRCRLRVEHVNGPSSLDVVGRVIQVNPHQHPRHVQIDIAHEAGHYLMIRAGLRNIEVGAKYLSGALLGPRRVIDLDVEQRGWSIAALQERHSNMPALALALRITQVRDAVATIFHPTRRMEPWRRASPWITDRAITEKASKIERDFASKAWKAGRDLHGEDQHAGLHATLVHDEYDDGPRVIVVRDLRQLALRFDPFGL